MRWKALGEIHKLERGPGPNTKFKCQIRNSSTPIKFNHIKLMLKTQIVAVGTNLYTRRAAIERNQRVLHLVDPHRDRPNALWKVLGITIFTSPDCDQHVVCGRTPHRALDGMAEDSSIRPREDDRRDLRVPLRKGEDAHPRHTISERCYSRHLP